MTKTKRALLMSVLSLLLCFSMLIGSTFAWFTDSVTSNNNIIKSGNLDVELEYYDGDSWEKVTATTNVFEENTLWEPGHTEVVYLKVSNLGTLALKYNLGINIVNEVESVNVAGEALRLSDYIVFDAIEDVDTPYADRAAARAAVTEADVAKLSAGHTKTGEIKAGDPAQYVALVVYMPESVGNEANYRTGEVAPKITLGVNLMATQLTAEIDSFDNQYDKDAMFGGVPAARVTVLADLPTVTTINGNTYTLNTGYVFNATETYDQAQLNAHRYWHADFVASFDRDVDDAAIGLAGQYDTYSPDWLAFELDGVGDIAANTPVRMLEFAGISMNYEELCLLVKEFSCGAFAVDPAAMAGTTMTVELRLYETTVDPNTGAGNKNVETGKYITIGTYSYTFDAIKAATQAELDAAVADGAKEIALSAGEYKFPAGNLKAGMTVVCEEGTVFTGNSKANINGATVVGATFSNPTGTTVDQTVNGTFKDCVFDGSNALRWCYAGETVVFENCVFTGDLYGVHFDGGANDLTFKNCTFSGFNAFPSAATKLTLEECTFKANGRSGYNGINMWGSTELINCTFVFDGSATQWIDAMGSNTTINATGCVISDGTTERALAASDIGDYGTGNTITVS